MKLTISKISLLAAVLAFMLGLAAGGCKGSEAGKADKQLSEMVGKLTFPQKLNDNTTLSGCTYADKVLTFRFETSADSLKKLDSVAMRASTLQKLRTGLFPQNLVQHVIKAGASIRYVYVNGTDTVSFAFAPSELK